MGYSVFYSFSKEKESLIIRFSNKEVTYKKSLPHVVVSFNGVDVVSYHIKDINKIIKIYADGLIPLVSDEMLDIINSLLIKDGLEPLEKMEHSNFYNAQVINQSPLTVKTSEGEFLVDNDNAPPLLSSVVMAKKNVFLFDESFTNDNHLCTYKELNINDSDEIFIADNLDIKEDFFQSRRND